MLMMILMMILRLLMYLSIVKDIILVGTGALLCEKSLATKSCALPVIQILLVIINLDMLHNFFLVSLPFGRGAVNIQTLLPGCIYRGALLRALSLEFLGELGGLLSDLQLLPHVLSQVVLGASDFLHLLRENFPIVIQSVPQIVAERSISKV